MTKPSKNSFRTRLSVESLESRQLLSAVPYGAGTHDVSEFLLGSVAVNVVFMESNGNLDPDTETWTDDQRDQVKANIEEALEWWEDTLAMYTDVHRLSFEVDYTYADDPVETKYEPISRNSNDFRFWIEDFFRHVNVPSSNGFTSEIRTYNHWLRESLDTNWGFTLFVVNAANDEDQQFGDDQGRTVFRRAFAYPGGQFIVMPHHRPPATIAHEIAHIFWAHDEYGGSDHYTERRGYYNTQNTNALDGHPNPNEREDSLMWSLRTSNYEDHLLSQSARETLGWRDSDGDGIFDVLDVPHITVGNPEFDAESRTIRFAGNSAVRTLENLNSSGSSRDMTINKITDLQYRVDAGSWTNLAEFDDYQVAFDVTTAEIPLGSEFVEFRTIDSRIGLASNTVGFELPEEPSVPSEPVDPEPSEPIDPDPVEPDPEPVDPEPTEPTPTEPDPSDPQPTDPQPTDPTPTDPVPTAPVLTNPDNQYDVSGDGFVSAIDALKVIIAINDGISTPTESGPPYLDVTGDGVVSSRDVLLVINHINRQSAAEAPTVNLLSTNRDQSGDGAAAEPAALLAFPMGPHPRAVTESLFARDENVTDLFD